MRYLCTRVLKWIGIWLPDWAQSDNKNEMHQRNEWDWKFGEWIYMFFRLF